MRKNKKNLLPDYFKPILWSYNISKINLDKYKKFIIVNTINYGDLKHWRWILKYYGKSQIQEILANSYSTEFRPRALKLALLVFSLKDYKYASRSLK